MIEALLVVLTVIFFDRVFPARTALADLRASRPTLEEVYRRYGWVSFPRTVLALVAIGVGIARFAVKLEGLWIDVAVAGAGACLPPVGRIRHPQGLPDQDKGRGTFGNRPQGMIWNIIDHRTRPHRWKRVNVIIEAVEHDNSCADADQAEAAEPSLRIDHESRNGVSVQEAIQWANAQPCPVTLYIYDGKDKGKRRKATG